MSLRSLFRAWNEFFYKPVSPLPVCIFRIIFGIVGIANLFLLRPEWMQWYGPHAFVSMETVTKLSFGPSMSLFQILPQTDLAINIFFWVFVLFTTMLTVGFMTRFAAVAVYLCLGTIQMRNGYILNSGDTLMMVTGFFLMFAPSGALLSVDHWLRVRRGREDATVKLYSPWAQRMLQIQTGVVYFATFYWKSMGVLWVNGMAVYYALRLEDFRRFPLPPIHNLYLIRSLTWSTLLIEFALGVLIWFKETRYYVLLAGVCLHIGIEYSMNIPLFEWIMVGTYVNFIEPKDLTKIWNWVHDRTMDLGHKLSHVRAVQHERDVMPASVNVTDEPHLS
jgi:Vitamin K-dependent gamma-carboxylase